MQPLITVIIPFRNASRTIARCLDALGNQKSDNWEAVLIDNNSTDDSAKLVSLYIANHPELTIVLVSEKKEGASAARNCGARSAKGTWLAFTDSDCMPDCAWLSDFESAIDAYPRCSAFAGTVLPYPESNPVARFTGMFTLPANRNEQEHASFSLVSGGFPSANLMVRHDLFEKIGGFNESIAIYGEDWELCCRIYESGSTLRALTAARVKHIHRQDLKGLLRQSFGIGRSHAYCLRHLVPGAIVVNGPASFIAINRQMPGMRLWLDFHPIDKKLLLLIFAGLCWTPAVAALPLFLVLSICKMRRRANRFGYTVTTLQSLHYVGLLILKSSALGLGRVLGSLRQRVICI